MARLVTPPTDAELRDSNIDPDDHRNSILDYVRIARQHGGFVDEKTLRAWGIDPDDDGVFWLPGYGAPMFQFRDKALRPVVAEINRAFSVPNELQDAYGLADWWLLPNGYLPGYKAPVECLGSVPDKRLLDAALSEISLG